jgi:pyridoxal phosphate enzyme (YggS family)
MHSIPTHIAHVRNRIADTAKSAGRRAEDVRLVAVTKERTVDEIDAAVTAGVVDFGENYVQEALPKIAALSARAITWHFIGAIQSNKTRDIATHFQWVHTIDRAKIARRLSDQRPPDAVPLDVLVQVNVDDEPQKAGVSRADAAALVEEIAPLPRLRLRGLMTVPKPERDAAKQRAAFDVLAELFEQTRPAGSRDWDTLSMGMSDDFAVAIEAGSTMVRVGTAIFGARRAKAAS